MPERIPPDEPLHPLPGSERLPAPELRGATPLDPAAHVDATLVLRRRESLSYEAIRQGSSRQEAASRYGASDDDVAVVTRVLEAYGIRIEQVDAPSRRVRIAGTAEQMSRAFGTGLERAESTGPDGRRAEHRHRTGGLAVPEQLAGVVTAVLGLDDRPQFRPHHRIAPAAAVAVSYTPLQLGEVYRFPPDTDGTGQTIAILELGGGYAEEDLDAYFTGLGVTAPSVTAVGIDGAANAPGSGADGADGEVLLDIEVAGALAPGATFLVYFAPNTDAGFLDALSAATHAEPTPTAISISWGQSEDEWTAQGRTAFDEALADAAVLGVTVTAAAGDDGSTDREADGSAHVDFPASSPHALACGGTSLHSRPGSGEVRSETVWNNGSGGGATGGGVSDVFTRPTWQDTVGVPFPRGKSGRGVPDVAGDADPQTGYRVRVDGKDMVIGGTSAVAPLWAALIARLAQSLGHPLGLAQPSLYEGIRSGMVACGFRDIVVGSNGAYDAIPGWDPCTGLGVPDGIRLKDCLTSVGATGSDAIPAEGPTSAR